MIFQNTNLFSQRFIKVSNTDSTTLGAIYTGLILENVLSKEPDSWLDALSDFSDVVGALDKIKREFFDPSVIKHRPQTTTITLKAIVELTGLSQTRAALVAYLLSECRISGYDVDYNYRHHVDVDTSNLPNTEQLLAAALAGKFFAEEFSVRILAAIGRAKTFVSQGATFKSERVYILSDTAVPNTINEYRNAFKNIQIRALEGCSEDYSYHASHYAKHVFRAVAQSLFYHTGSVSEGAAAQLGLCSESAVELAKCKNIVAEVLSDVSKISDLLKTPCSPAFVNRASAILKNVGSEALQIYKPTTGLQYLGLFMPCELIRGDGAAYLVPSLASSTKPIAEVIARTPGYMGVELRPVATSTKAVVSIAQKEFEIITDFFKGLSTTVALAKRTGRPLVKSIMKDWVAKLDTMPTAALLDVLFDQGCAVHPVSYSAGVLRYQATADWSAIAVLTGDARFLGLRGCAPFLNLQKAVFALCVSYPVPDVDAEDSSALSSVFSRGGTSIEVDPDWVDSLLTDEAQRETGKGTLLGVKRMQFNTASAIIVTPDVARALEEAKRKSEKIDSTKMARFTRVVEDLWDRLGIVGSKKVLVSYDLQVDARIDRLSKAVLSMISDVAPSSAGALALNFLRELATRARKQFGGIAYQQMADQGASFDFNEHTTAYDVELNVAFSLTCINLLVTAVGVVAPKLASLITQLVDWGTTYTVKTGIKVFDVGSLKEEVAHV